MGFDAVEVRPSLWGMTMDTEASLKEYLSLQLKVPLIARVGPLAKTFDFMASARPRCQEILTVGKLCYEVREDNYDLVVVDAPATGHVVGQLMAPQAINELVQVGLVRQQTRWMLDMLEDSETTGVCVVTAPEEMPVTETIELLDALGDKTAVSLAAVIVNRVLPELFDEDHRKVFDRLSGPKGRSVLDRELGGIGRSDRRSRRSGNLASLPSHGTHRQAGRGGGGQLAAGDRALSVQPVSWNQGHAAGGRRSGSRGGTMSPKRAGSRATDASIERLIAAKDVVITCGSGGVGKTTTAAAIGAMAAAQLGGRVLVLTVDPARRLATALGLEEFGNVETEVPRSLFVEAGVEPRGQLFAAMLDTKQSWDDLVRRHAPDAETRDSILDNPLYQNVTGKFVQSHDYIAMERLYEIHSSGVYDLIVVDTPPTRNAIDFLEAPERMADFFSSRLLRWLIAPYRSRLLNAASRPFLNIADRILGSQFLQDIAEFFILFQTMYDGFVNRARAVERLLVNPRTSFVVVSTLESAPVAEARFFIDRLVEEDYHLGAVVLNKVLPPSLLTRGSTGAARELKKRSAELGEVLATKAQSPELVGSVLTEMAENFLNFQVVAKREAEERAELAATAEVVAAVPFFDDDIADLAGLLALGGELWDQR